MGQRILNKVIGVLAHYKVHVLAVLAVAFCGARAIGKAFITQYTIGQRRLGGGFDFEYLYTVCMDVLLAMLFLAVAVTILFIVIYDDQTDGRNLLKDQWQYRLTPMELLRRFKDSDPYRIREKDLQYIYSWKQADGIILGRCGKGLLYHPTHANRGEGKVTLVVGAPGSGKTSSVICCSALQWDGPCFCIDIKGDIYAAVKNKRKVLLFDPEHPAISAHFDPLADIRTMTQDERNEFLENTAMTIVPDDNSPDSKYFIQTARSLFVGIVNYLYASNSQISLPDVCNAILEKSGVEWVVEIHDGMVDEAKRYTNGLYGSSEKNVNGAHGELARAVRPYTSGNLAEVLTDNGNCISLQKMEDGYDIYAEIAQDKLRLMAPICTLLAERLMMTAVTSRPDVSSGQTAAPILFILDEVFQLSWPSFDVLSALVSTGRSKFCSALLACQSTSQGIRKFDKEAFTELVDDCAYVSVYSAHSPDSQKFWSDYFGTKKSLKMSTTESGSYGDVTNMGGTAGTGTQETREPVIRPEEFATLGNKVAVKANGRYCLAEKIKWYE